MREGGKGGGGRKRRAADWGGVIFSLAGRGRDAGSNLLLGARIGRRGFTAWHLCLTLLWGEKGTLKPVAERREDLALEGEGALGQGEHVSGGLLLYFSSEGEGEGTELI